MSVSIRCPTDGECLYVVPGEAKDMVLAMFAEAPYLAYCKKCNRRYQVQTAGGFQSVVMKDLGPIDWSKARWKD